MIVLAVEDMVGVERREKMVVPTGIEPVSPA